jgi:predicted O-methyltransferase YrrM
LRLDKQQLKIRASRFLERGPLRPVTERIRHLTAPPTLHHISSRAELLTANAAEATVALLGEGADHGDEYENLTTQQAGPGDAYPDFFKIGDSTARLLYSVVRHLKPDLVVEVGVADGRSTQTILNAMDANEAGRLVSVDIADDVGGPARGHPRWTLHIHSVRNASTELAGLLDREGPADVFFHDAGHTYASQYADYLVGYDGLRPGGVFISDDIDWSWAFLDLAYARDLRPIVLADLRKAVGAFVRTDAGRARTVTSP